MPHKSKGVLIYAFNSKFDYVQAAIFAAKQATKFLNLPVTLVTNVPVNPREFESVFTIDDNTKSIRQYRFSNNVIIETEWFNSSRTSAYALSPYEQTLLIDADYFMFNNSLLPIFETNSEFACFSEINDVSTITTSQLRLSRISIPMQWATVIYFTKCPFANAVFDFMEIIKNNWEYYSLLYNFRNDAFRNDFALSIALQTLSGYSTKNFNKLPGKLHTIFPIIDIVEVDNGKIIYRWDNELNKLINTNIHCINKKDLDKFYA